MLLYSYVKTSDTEKKDQGMSSTMNVLSEDIGMVKQPPNPKVGGAQRCFPEPE